MKVGVLSYPMLWQRTGGLQVQITKSLKYLKKRGNDVHLFNPLSDRLHHFDVIHVFAAINGTHRLVEEARSQGVKTVMTPLIHADNGLLKRKRYAIASWLTAKISNYEIKTTFDEVRAGLNASDHILALSEAEKRTLIEIHGQPQSKISVVPNGIDPQFFAADAGPFHQKYGHREKFVLVVGSISPYKNQLGVIRATREAGWPVVLIGPDQDSAYLQQCLHEGGGRVHYLGTIPHDDPLLASAYGSAGVTVLASEGESFGLAAVESLAAGTPAIITEANGLGIEARPPILTYVTASDTQKLAAAISDAMGAQAAVSDCRGLVARLSWDHVSEKIEDVYRHVASR